MQPPSQPRPIARWLGFSGGPAGINEESGGRRNSGFAPFFSLFSQRVNNLVVTYLHWTFRSSFAAFFLSAAIAFFALTIFFALLIWALGRKDPTCIGGADFESDFFADAYALSWTTFSTVVSALCLVYFLSYLVAKVPYRINTDAGCCSHVIRDTE